MAGAPNAEDPQLTLDRVRRESEVLGASSLARAAGVGAERDPVEIWGKRVGRSLSIVLAIALVWWLGVQLAWWPPP